ncbi:hypothetical protein LTR78_008574 [Recurvomyces mirabilis]|uniref:Uncharacterized protein n=1 Tax=Recurvomyces mirabilis TaxID=574656 RepID=A0AAE0WGW2_9PEZI|nr:hypothetical protein LTR78_008574 [Recurvomyces mirabilis]KAK5153514.1 hypothetical protein LTS14_007685 [Recurvomyces mirabilis]
MAIILLVETGVASPRSSYSPPTPPPKDTPKQRKKKHRKKAHYASVIEASPVAARNHPLSEEVMASAFERRRRRQHPSSAEREGDGVQNLLQGEAHITWPIAENGLSDLPANAYPIVPSSTPLHVRHPRPSRIASPSPFARASPSYADTTSHAKSSSNDGGAVMAGDLLTSFPETSLAILDTASMDDHGKARHIPRDELGLEGPDLRALLRDLDHQEEEKELASTVPKSSMQWDSEDEERNGAEVEVEVDGKRRWRSKLMKKPKRKSDESNESSRSFTDPTKIAAKWKQKISSARSKAFADAPGDSLTAPMQLAKTFTLPDHMLSPATSSFLNAQSDNAEVPGPEVTPWIYQEELARITSSTTEFIRLHPPPPIPKTNTTPAERGLRSVKSDCSIRTTAAGNKIAAEIGPAKRAVALSTAKFKHSPTFHITQAVESRLIAVPASIKHEWEEAIQTTRAKVKAAKLQMESAVKSAHQHLDKHDVWRKNGDRLIARASRLGYAPVVDWDKLTTKEVEAFGYALERDSDDEVKQMFRHVGEQAAKDAVIKHSYLKKQKWLDERTRAARADGRLSAEQDKKLRTASQLISNAIIAVEEGREDDAVAMMKHASDEQGSLLDTPEKRDHTNHNHRRSERASAESERMRTYEALCTAGQDYSHVTTQAAAAGLGITLDEDMGMAGAMNTPQRPRAVSYTQSELDDFMASAGSSNRSSFQVSTHSVGAVSPTSPLADRPLKVQRSPLAPRDKFGKPVFHPHRDGDFVRKIQAEAERAKAIRAMGSHPALRATSHVELELGPATAPMLQLNDVSDFRQQLRTDKHDSKEYEDEELYLLEDYGSDCEDDSLNGRISAMTWDYNNETETAQLEEQLIQLEDQHEGSTWSPLAYQIGLSRLSKFMDLQYPGSPQQPQGDEEEIEYVDNPDYDHHTVVNAKQTVSLTGLGVQEFVTPTKTAKSRAITTTQHNSNSVGLRAQKLTTPSRQTKQQPVPRPTMSVDIDDVIAQWERKPRQLLASRGTDVSPSNVPAIRGAVSETHLLRVSLGLLPLKTRKPSSGPKHPHHDYEWDTEKVMCYGKHTGRSKIVELNPVVREQLRQDEYRERGRAFAERLTIAKPESPSPHFKALTKLRIDDYQQRLRDPSPEVKQKLQRCASVAGWSGDL